MAEPIMMYIRILLEPESDEGEVGVKLIGLTDDDETEKLFRLLRFFKLLLASL